MPAGSVPLLAATATVTVAPSVLGVQTWWNTVFAVSTEKVPAAQFVNVKSPSAMPVISSENVKIMVVAPLCDPPVLTSAEVMVTVGAVVS